MGFMFILVLCLTGVFCLAPLGLYFLWLSFLARRDRPTILSGQWDFVGLVVGLSGFVFFGGGVVLSLFQSNFRYWMRGNFEALRAAWGQEKVTWILLSVLYLMLVTGWIALTLGARRRSLVIYNIEPAIFEAMLAEVFEQMNRPVERRGNTWYGGVPLCEIDRFVGGRTVTLRWVADDLVHFQEVERLLREAGRDITSDRNPAAALFGVVALSLMMVSLTFADMIVYLLLGFFASMVGGVIGLICLGLLIYLLFT